MNPTPPRHPQASSSAGSSRSKPLDSGTSTLSILKVSSNSSLTPTIDPATPLSSSHVEDENIQKISHSAQPREVRDRFRDAKGDELFYRSYRSEEEDLGNIMDLVAQELSEPYNVYTYRYFLDEWPHLTFLVYPSQISKKAIAVIVCKQESHKGKTSRGYIAMLSVDKDWRRRGIASKLVGLAIVEMTRRGAHEVVLETEHDNLTSLALYDSLGFLREKRLQRFYSNGKDA
ncbi:hypothetical protein M231_00186 [Tremella mesenterica]|uniref:N-acetyltransferase domain-containing protein n=1 Tax=Tremella mesenterica TaxID=5217 RepID=A0A4Q1BWY5_TREME|nr:hypothetical protein M231_00186 [Tremella mesenterica]